jgi:hypothetical protein
MTGPKSINANRPSDQARSSALRQSSPSGPRAASGVQCDKSSGLSICALADFAVEHVAKTKAKMVTIEKLMRFILVVPLQVVPKIR